MTRPNVGRGILKYSCVIHKYDIKKCNHISGTVGTRWLGLLSQKLGKSIPYQVLGKEDLSGSWTG